MSSNLENIKKYTIEKIADIAHREISMSFEELKSHARQFIITIDKIYSSMSTSERGARSSPIVRIYKAYNDAVIAQAFSLAVQAFSLALDNFLERTIVLTAVDEEGNLLLYTEAGEAEVYSNVGAKKNEGRASLNKEAMLGKDGKIPEKYKKLIYGGQDLKRLIDESVEQRFEVYKEAFRRYNNVANKVMHDPAIETFYVRTRYPHMIFMGPETFNRGHLSEAYANAVVQEDPSITNSDVNESIRNLYNNYLVGKKDNIWAIKKGDVQVTKDGKVSLAVKTAASVFKEDGSSIFYGSSTARIGQYIVAALKLQEFSNFTKEDVKKWLEGLNEDIGNYAKNVEELSKVKLEQHIYRLVKTWSKNG